MKIFYFLLLLATGSISAPVPPAKAPPTIEGMTIVVSNMEAMVHFYTKVFDLRFTPQPGYGTTLHSALWGQLKVLFCPNTVADVYVKRNRHQFDIVVENIDQTIQQVKTSGGWVMEGMYENDQYKSLGIYDPDSNSIVLKEWK